jgi:hypothetical protein
VPPLSVRSDYFSGGEKAITTFRRWADVLSCGAIF